MKVAEPKFKIGDEVETNELYRKMFCRDIPFRGLVSEIEPYNIKDDFGRSKETVILVSVDGKRSINQDYFELVKA